MNDNQQMLKAILNGQHALKASLENKIDKLDKKIDKVEERLDSKLSGVSVKLDRVEKNLTERIDKLGKQLAYLEDDTPTKEEFDGLKNRVTTIEEKITPTL